MAAEQHTGVEYAVLASYHAWRAPATAFSILILRSEPVRGQEPRRGHQEGHGAWYRQEGAVLHMLYGQER